jgi:hypothetical protein
MGSSNNTLNTALKKMGLIDKITLFNVLITVMILVSYFLVIAYQEFRRPNFLEGIFGLTHIKRLDYNATRLHCVPSCYGDTREGRFFPVIFGLTHIQTRLLKR